jgi:hypothetical protein
VSTQPELASSLTPTADALNSYQISLRALYTETTLAAQEGVPFAGVVALEGAMPAGVRPLAQRVATSGPRPGRWRINPVLSTRKAIQASIAVAIALPVGDALNDARFYWAVIGVMIIIAATSTSHERGRKVVRRLAGTVIGAVLGIGIHSLIGPGQPWWFLTVIVVALTICAYAITVNYPVYVTCLVITLTQVYSLSGVDLHTTLLYRLAENGIGAVTAAVIAAVVLPISTYSVIRTGLDGYLQALKTFAADLTVHLTDPNAAIRIRSNARAVDHALFQFRGAVSHLLPPISVLGNGRAASRYQRAKTLTDMLAAVTGDVHSLAHLGQPATSHPDATDPVVQQGIKAVTQPISDAQRRHDGTPAQGATPTADQPAETNIDGDPRVQNTVTLLRSLATQISLVTLHLQHTTGGERFTTVGSAQFAIRDLKLIDGAMARMAEVLGSSITGYDTIPAGSGNSGGMRIRGRVCGPHGAGIRAVLTLIDHRGRQVARAVAGPDGEYWLGAPAPGAYTLLTSAASYAPAASTVTVREPGNGSGTVMNVRLANTGSLSGRVVTKTGARPVPGVRLTLIGTTGATVAMAETGQTGRYAFEGIADGQYTLLASGYPPTTSALHISGSDRTIQHDVELRHPTD